MLPLDAARSPDRRLSSVVLPAPFGPSTACSLPRSSASATPLTAASPPKRRVNPSVASRTSDIARIPDQHAPEPPGDAGEATRQEDHQQDDRPAQQQLPVSGQRLEDLS